MAKKCVLLFYLAITTCRNVNSLTESFTDTTLIGNTLVDQSTVAVETTPYTYLMFDAGNFGLYGLTDGYLLGFQWTTDTDSIGENVNFQIYSAKSLDNDGLGQYRLEVETGKLATTETSNLFYFKEPVVGVQFYFLTVVQYGDVLPVHTQSCDTQSKVLGSADSPSLEEGELTFDTVYSECLSFSVQAIYLPTHYASLGCSMFIIEENTEEEWSYTRVSLFEDNRCWLFRSAREGLNVEFEEQHFEVACDNELRIQGYDTGLAVARELRSACGETFDTWSPLGPYAHATLSASGSGTISFTFAVRNQDDEATSGGGGFPAWGIGLLVTAGIVVFVVCFSKHKHAQGAKKNSQVGNTAPPTTQTSTSVPSSTTTSTPSTTSTSSTSSGATTNTTTSSSVTSSTTTTAIGTTEARTPALTTPECPPYNRLPPLALPQEPPPSYDSVIALERQQAPTGQQSMSLTTHNLYSANTYGVPDPARYEEPK